MVIYFQEENRETNIIIFFNVKNLLMRENVILIINIREYRRDNPEKLAA
jgi:hypothetical protein